VSEQTPNLLVEQWPIENVLPYENNPRLNDAAVDAVVASIRDFGWRQPIDTVQRHVAEGLPTDASRRIHLVEYVAWMIGRLEK